LWDEAISCATKSAEAFREAGEIRGWGGATEILAWLLRLKGEYGISVTLSEEVLSIGQDGKDSIVVGWALQGLGRAFWHAGLHERGIPLLSKAIECFREAPDYPSLACATSDLGMCYLRQGKVGDALATLETSMDIIKSRHLRGFLSTQAFLGLAEGYLLKVTMADGTDRVQALGKAKAACQSAGRHVAHVSEGQPGYYRLQANYYWMKGQHRTAEKLWARSVELSEQAGNLYELATTRLDIARFLKKSPDLQGQAVQKQIELQVKSACSTALLSSL
jgi:tetratricopeptide (TPR) repeat protein